MLSRERLQERFIEMIKIYSPSKGEKEMADWIENWLRERNIPFQSDHAGEAYGGNGRRNVPLDLQHIWIRLSLAEM